VTEEEVEAKAKATYEQKAAHYFNQHAWSRKWEELSESDRERERRDAREGWEGFVRRFRECVQRGIERRRARQ
jgi:hypothetical protein